MRWIRRRPQVPRRHRVSPFAIAVVAELLALGLSLAANLAAVWNDEIAQRWVAGALPVLLLVGTYLFLAHRVPVVWSWNESGWLAWYANLAAGLAFLVPPAMASYWHQRVLLLGTDGYQPLHGLPTLLATLLPLTVDGVAIRAAMTLWAPEPTSRHASAAHRDGSVPAPHSVPHAFDEQTELRVIDAIDELPRGQLRDLAKSLGLTVRGSRAQVAARVRDHQHASVPDRANGDEVVPS